MNLTEDGPAPASPPLTILVVEDDRAIRYLFTQVLNGHGYQVIACENGEIGLESARANIDTLAAVVTDSAMPGLDGREMVAQIRALRPDMPILIISGNVEDSGGVKSEGAHTVRLTKPLSPARLTLELRRLLCDTM